MVTPKPPTVNGGGTSPKLRKHTHIRRASFDDADPVVGNTTWLQWFWVLPVFTLIPYLFVKLHYVLPKPLPPLDENGFPQPSEELILGHIQALEDIGFRTVGTREAVNGEEYVMSEVRKIEERCLKNGILNCEVWMQQGDGYHSFDIMDHAVLKVYKGIRNVVLRVSAKNPPSRKAGVVEKDAILLGAHIDSTLPSPGATDDGIGVGVMLDIARVLIDRNQPFDSSVIFMWNGGEETLQDGSHLYSTQHETADSVRAMINLEAAGSRGGALLFQATSKEMIETCAYAPHPRGSVIAAEVFSSGIILSDTDFGQFETYLNVSGLDMAIVGHSYFYHTRKDQTKYIEKGSSQHFANNVMGMLDYLLGPTSPLLTNEPFSPPDIVYLTMYDRLFLSWSMDVADRVYVGMATVVVAFVLANMNWKRIKPFGMAIIGTPLGLLAGLIVANSVAGIMLLIGKGQSWFSHEFLCLLLYIPAGFIGHLSTQYFLSSLLTPAERTHLEHAHYFAELLFSAWYMLIMQAYRIRSAYVFALITTLLLIGAVGNEIGRLGRGMPHTVALGSAYLLPMIGFMCIGVEAGTTTLDIFVPLTGRMGKDAPAEFIIAVISSMFGFTFLPPLTPLFHRASRRAQRRTIMVLIAFTLGVMGLFAGPWWSPYDFMHPRRVGVQYTYNHTSAETTCHVAFMDRGGGTTEIMKSIHDRYGSSEYPIVPTVLTEYDSDWDTLYPISAFLETYRFQLKVEEDVKEFDWPKIRIEVGDVPDSEKGLRHLKMKFHHPNLVWPVLAFDAEIVDWTFDFEPPKGKKRHHIKAASSIDDPVTELDLTIRMEDGEKLSIHWSAIDGNQMVPGTAKRLGPDMPASKFLLGMDQWIEDTWMGTMDVLMTGVVVGILEV